MALRGFVTGSDACTPSEGGAGPSNAVAGLANTLLGRSGKAQEQLHELPGQQGLPGTSATHGGPSTAADWAAAAVHGESVPIPGMAPAFDVEQDVAAFLGGMPGPSHAAHQRPMDAAWQGSRGMSEGSTPLTPFLQAFVNSAKLHTHFHPLPSVPMHLSTAEQCRIRDRSTIMARHLFADRGDAYADQQVMALMQSLHIDPHALPAQAPGEWEAIWQQRQGPPGAGAELAAAAQHQASLQDPAWVRDFERMRLQGAQPGQAWADDFAKQGQPQGWSEEFLNGQHPRDGWADEFAQQSLTSTSPAAQQESSAKALEQTRALADTLSRDANPKFQNSKFLQFVSKMSRGEIILEDNQAKEQARPHVDHWAHEFRDANTDDLEAVWKESTQMGGPLEREGQVHERWAREFGHEAADAPAHDWADEFANGVAAPFTADGTDVDAWADEFEAHAGQFSQAAASTSHGEYVFSPNNPFAKDLNSLQKGRELFRKGLLSEAVLALEAEVQRNPRNAEAWRLLGTVQAENDDDQQAICALQKAHEADPSNAEKHPNHAAAASTVPSSGDSSQALTHAIQCFQQAVFQAPQDADIHVALGVLFNLAREYDAAVASLRAALALQPQDYALWNKLGATLANSAHSSEAISAYQKALDLKPNYMRAWTNMGISQANVGNYEASARYYVRALSLNSRASNVWGYLRNSLACAGLMDLMPAVEQENLQALEKALSL
ncbi:hypothetical protein WJX73_000203 [Symbiochloris irregularis]|uniref:Peroxin-5 n=1 Tax=Symbiochloris irregularis TaxID=706552 RepID=A0AAW1NUJ7_9CHLO